MKDKAEQKGSLALAGWLFALVLVGLLLSACEASTDRTGNYDTYSQNGTARSAALVPTEVRPQTVTVVDRTEQGPYLSSGARMQLGREGTLLYVLDQRTHAVKAVDPALSEVVHETEVCPGASNILLAPDELTLLVACGPRGTIEFVDTTTFRVVDRIRVCDQLDHLAQDPTGRLVYAACSQPGGIAITVHELSLARPSATARLLVSGSEPGPLQVLNADGCPLWKTEPTSGWLGAFALLSDPELAAAAFTNVGFTGDAGVWGDGRMTLEQGVVVMDLDTGSMMVVLVEGGPRRTWPGEPGRLAVMPSTGDLLIPLSGWGEVLQVEAPSMENPSEGPEPEVKASGLVLGRSVTGGRPEEVVAATLPTDGAYVLDTGLGVVTVLDTDLSVSRHIPL